MPSQHLKKIQRYTGMEFPSVLEKNLSSISYLILRLSASLMIVINHGWGKISHYSSSVASFPDPLSIGSKWSLLGTIGAEFFAGLFLAVGLFTRLSSAVLLFTMCVIVFIFHAEDPFKTKELAVVYGLLYLCFGIGGGGKWSLDYLLSRLIKSK